MGGGLGGLREEERGPHELAVKSGNLAREVFRPKDEGPWVTESCPVPGLVLSKLRKTGVVAREREPERREERSSMRA